MTVFRVINVATSDLLEGDEELDARSVKQGLDQKIYLFDLFEQ